MGAARQSGASRVFHKTLRRGAFGILLPYPYTLLVIPAKAGTQLMPVRYETSSVGFPRSRE
jgi:hypothetical protein